jgi:acetyl-CoA acetyltransferase
MDHWLRNKTAIVGVGYTPMVRKSEKSLAAVAMDAALAAIADAGLTTKDIDGYSGTPKAPNASAMHADGVDEISERYMASALGLTNLRWATDVNRGVVADGIVAGIQSLVMGTANYVLCMRAMYDRPGVRYASTDQGVFGGPDQYTAPYGVGIGAISLWLTRYMHDYGATREDLFEVVGTLREHAQLNEYAYWRGKPLTLDDYMSARFVYEPMCLYDYDIPVTGAGAVVLTTADRARALPHRPAYVAGFANTRAPGDAIFDLSGIGRDAVQAAQLYDGFSPVVWKWLEALGFCGEGEAHAFARGGRIKLGGELPVTTFGGSQGEGRLHGMGHVREGAMQVMGRAGERQVPGLENCLVALGFDSVPGWVLMLSTG